MIPVANVVLDSESTFEGKSFEMGFDEEAVQHLMSVLSSMYGDPVGAVVREYITNAIDSHTEAGQTRPVEVTTPSPFESFFTVQDFGIGMDESDIEKTYRKYGTSTKRQSNDFNGMIGIGSKSAFSYTNQFTVVGVKNGISTSVVVSRSELGGGKMQIVDQRTTEDPNGVKIVIPVEDDVKFRFAVINFTQWLPKGLVMVDGADRSNRDSWVRISDAIEVDGKTLINGIFRSPINRDQDYIFMGNVMYPVHFDLSDRTGSIIADVPIGTVKFAPSRESLMDSAQNTKVIEQIVHAYESDIADSLMDQIQETDSKAEALKIYFGHKSLLKRRVKPENLNYRGLEFPKTEASEHFAVQWAPRNARYSVYTNQPLPYNPQNTLFVKNYKRKDSIPSNHKAKTKEWMTQNGYSWNYYGGSQNDKKAYTVLFVNDIPTDPWFDAADFVDWDEIAKIKLASTGTGGGGLVFDGKHLVLGPTGFDIEHITPKDKIHYFHLAEDKKYDSEANIINNLRLYQEIVGKDVKIVNLYRGRLAKFNKEFPKAKGLTYAAAIDTIEKAKYDKITDEDRKGLAVEQIRYNHQNLVREIARSGEGVKDPALNELIELLQIKSKVSHHSLSYKYREIVRKETKEFYEEILELIHEFIGRYKIFNLISTPYNGFDKYPAELIEYMNFIYERNNT